MIAFKLWGTIFSIVSCAPCTGLISIVNESKLPSNSASVSMYGSLVPVPQW
jgi:hypothetical protein